MAIGWIFILMAGYNIPVRIGRSCMAFLGYPLPIALMSIVLSYIGIPSLSHSTSVWDAEIKHLEGFRELFKHRLAIACVIGSILGSASFTAIIVYGISLYRRNSWLPKS
jgi:hypothetical protein